MIIKTLCLLVLLGLDGCLGDDDIYCGDGYCSNVVCPDLPLECQVQNATHNGVVLPSPEPCNCCPFCVINLKYGEQCSKGGVDSVLPTAVCGPDLYCSDRGICEEMQSSCASARQDYDNRRALGMVGTMETRPVCDSHGNYASFKCIPGQTCYCVDVDRNRIFGETDFLNKPEQDLPCICSRKYSEAVEIIGTDLSPDLRFRCNSKGDYERLQCIGDLCLCVDAYDGAPTFPDRDLVNRTEVNNRTLPDCVSNPNATEFFKKCELEYLKVLGEYKQLKKDGYELVMSFSFPKCDIDGTYSRLQEDATSKMCVDPEGNILSTIPKTDPRAETMTCNCFRANAITSSLEEAECDPETGDYKPKQCRRGYCRCVDKNGNQDCKCSQSSCSACPEVPEDQADSLNC